LSLKRNTPLARTMTATLTYTLVLAAIYFGRKVVLSFVEEK